LKVVYGHSIRRGETSASSPPKGNDQVTTEQLQRFLEAHGTEVHLTFDDGYSDNKTALLNILEKFQQPVTLFIATGYVERTSVSSERVALEYLREYPEGGPAASANEAFKRITAGGELSYDALRGGLKYARSEDRIAAVSAMMDFLGADPSDMMSDFLTPSDLSELGNHPLVTVGSHTVTHPYLPSLTRRQMKEELAKSKERLEGWIGSPVNYLAVPYGGINGSVQIAAKDAGYKQIYGTESIKHWRLKRFFDRVKAVPCVRRLSLHREVTRDEGCDRIRS